MIRCLMLYIVRKLASEMMQGQEIYSNYLSLICRCRFVDTYVLIYIKLVYLIFKIASRNASINPHFNQQKYVRRNNCFDNGNFKCFYKVEFKLELYAL